MRRIMHRGLGILVISTGIATRAGAAAPSPLDRQNKVEDALADGDIDPEDFVSWRMPRPAALVGSRSHAYLAVSAFMTHGSAQNERGGMLVLQLPFERFLASPRPAVAAPIADPPPPQASAPERAQPAPAAVAISPADARACGQRFASPGWATRRAWTPSRRAREVRPRFRSFVCGRSDRSTSRAA